VSGEHGTKKTTAIIMKCTRPPAAGPDKFSYSDVCVCLLAQRLSVFQSPLHGASAPSVSHVLPWEEPKHKPQTSLLLLLPKTHCQVVRVSAGWSWKSPFNGFYGSAETRAASMQKLGRKEEEEAV
jgi:hypothetical protein